MGRHAEWKEDPHEDPGEVMGPMPSRRRRRIAWVVGITAGLLVLAGFVSFGPPQLMERTSTPEFCGETCHVMEPQYVAWSHYGPHRRVACVECHLPHANVFEYYLWKGIDGTRDIVAFTTDRVPDPITLSAHGQRVANGNCRRCHGETVARVKVADRDCWECHRWIRHRLAAVRVAALSD